MKVYLDDHSVRMLSLVANMSDEHVLTHRKSDRKGDLKNPGSERN